MAEEAKLSVHVEHATRGMWTHQWVIRCANAQHADGDMPQMEYLNMSDRFRCPSCGQIAQAENIYFSLPITKGLG